jgi:hypothetical protein
MLSNSGALEAEGSFLVRGASEPGAYRVSYTEHGEVVHVPLRQLPSQQWQIGRATSQEPFETLHLLVHHCMQSAEPGFGLTLRAANVSTVDL